MGILSLITVLMMSAVDSHPFEHRSLDRHGAEDSQQKPYRTN